jgi:hypothetical protein
LRLPYATAGRVGAFAACCGAAFYFFRPTGAASAAFVGLAILAYPLWLLATGEPVLAEIRLALSARSDGTTGSD